MPGWTKYGCSEIEERMRWYISTKALLEQQTRSASEWIPEDDIRSDAIRFSSIAFFMGSNLRPVNGCESKDSAPLR
jgi:hypothetical protein